VVVDHHASNPGFGDVRVVDPAAPATVALVADLLDGLGVHLDERLATCLYAGLTADTGSFRFGNTRPDTHHLAARLLATGIDHATISQRLFDTAPFGWLGLLSVVAGRAVLETEVGAGLVWTWSSTAEAAEHGLPGEQLEALVDVVRSTREADVACVLKGQDDGTWSVSLRSRGATDVARVAMALGGGGHRAAAGFTSHEDRETTMARLRRELCTSSASGLAPRPGAVPDGR
jgi:phosphoesterase RecJ-like protein